MEDKEEKAGPAKPKAPGRAAMAVSACALACALAAVGVACWQTSAPGQNSRPATEASAPAAQQGDGDAEQAQPAHTHDWTVTYRTVHHDAETHTEHVDAVYRARTTYHTVCNECEQVIDGIADQHIKDTGHSGYSTNVPIEDTVMESAAYDKVVTDKDAWDETVPDKMVCATCGETKDAEVAAAPEATGEAPAAETAA